MLKEDLQIGDYSVAIVAGSDGVMKEGVVCQIKGELIVIKDETGSHTCLRKFASRLDEAPLNLDFVQKVRHELFR